MSPTRLVRRLALVRALARMPVWVRVVLALISIALGAVIVVRPTAALDVLALLIGAGMVLTGTLELAGRIALERTTAEGESGEEGHPAPRIGSRAWWRQPGRWRLALPIGWIVLGAFVLAWPGLTVRAVAVITGVLLLVYGASGLGSALLENRRIDERIADAAFGATGVIFGVLAFGWPDITLLVVAVVFGGTLIVRGLAELWQAWRVRRSRPASDRIDQTAQADHIAQTAPTAAAPPARVRRHWGRAALGVVCVAASVVAVVATAPLRDGTAIVDDFYTAPRSIPSEPGRLIRAEPFTREVPADAEGWRILYTTTGVDGRIRVASGLVVVPIDEDGDGAPWPVIDWNHGTTGFAQHCAPSLQARPFWSGGLYPVRKVIAQGWAIVATDYSGLGTAGPHPYLFGRASATASLDAVRAARELDEANLGPSTVVWGHSQGGAAALWTGAIAKEYAPEVWIRGVAAFAPASDPPAIVGHVSEVMGGLIFASYAFAAFSSVYPDITYGEYIRPGLQPMLRAMSQRCLTDPDIALSVVGVVGTTIDSELFSKDPSYGDLGTRLRENVAPTQLGPPLFVGQGGSDSIVPPITQDRYVDRVCADGQRVEFHRYAGYEHAEVMENYSPMVADAIAWTQARFDGEYTDAGETCRTVDVPR